ncbi:helix-turn-helix domain-containing protein [Streptomyces durmitorensis]|uniref:AraC family transcriptional regulator n=1 Tax=Streptomyces durmitorensis TaxID=319947 RepID=A0ABY4PL63_9ACTN|nr:AraC family transcriptional regulator [Streptomyces durmitorensis]UQT54049.1 AraC family transcriptional regulator [Streptomyces durmitorensis]
MDPVQYEGDRLRGWEVACPSRPSPFNGVVVAGFRDRAAAGLDMRVIPQPIVTVVIELGDDALAVDNTSGSRALRSLAAGLAPGEVRIRGERVDCVELRMSPVSAYSLLGVSLSDLNGLVIGLDELWRHEPRLREQLTAAKGWEGRFALMDEFLTRRQASARSMDPEVVASWEHIVSRRGQVRVGDLALSCGWSRKRLWSRFTAQVGLTPKRAAMLVRFDRAVRGLSAGRGAAEVAVACGYVDQSHLHRDVLAFAGCTPGALGPPPDTDTAGASHR